MDSGAVRGWNFLVKVQSTNIFVLITHCNDSLSFVIMNPKMKPISAKNDGKFDVALNLDMARTSADLAAAAFVIEDEAKKLIERATPDNTRRAYEADWRAFEAFCVKFNLQVLPATAETIAAFMTAEHIAGKKWSTIQRRIAAIRRAHIAAKVEPATGDERISTIMHGIRKTQRDDDRGDKVGKTALSADDVSDACSSLGTTLLDLRDRAVFMLGLASAMRRGELAAITVEDLEFDPGEHFGVDVRIRYSKTDQNAEGRTIFVPREVLVETCPVAALEAWLLTAEISTGPVFRSIRRGDRLRKATEQDKKLSYPRISGGDVWRIVKTRLAAAGIDASEYGAHSLRSGFIVAAVDANVPLPRVMEQTGHRSVQTLMPYYRNRRTRDNAIRGLLVAKKKKARRSK